MTARDYLRRVGFVLEGLGVFLVSTVAFILMRGRAPLPATQSVMFVCCVALVAYRWRGDRYREPSFDEYRAVVGDRYAGHETLGRATYNIGLLRLRARDCTRDETLRRWRGTAGEWAERMAAIEAEYEARRRL